jgi:hypothetical protein
MKDLETPVAEVPAKKVRSAQEVKLESSLKEFAKLTNPEKRKVFYDSHPELAAIYSPVNFHSA